MTDLYPRYDVYVLTFFFSGRVAAGGIFPFVLRSYTFAIVLSLYY